MIKARSGIRHFWAASSGNQLKSTMQDGKKWDSVLKFIFWENMESLSWRNVKSHHNLSSWQPGNVPKTQENCVYFAVLVFYTFLLSSVRKKYNFLALAGTLWSIWPSPTRWRRCQSGSIRLLHWCWQFSVIFRAFCASIDLKTTISRIEIIFFARWSAIRSFGLNRSRILLRIRRFSWSFWT